MSGYHHITDWFQGFHAFINRDPDHRELARAFPFPKETFADLEKTLQIHKTGWNYSVRSLDPGFETAIARAVHDYQKRDLGLSPDRIIQSADRASKTLDRDGHLSLPPVPQDVISEIRIHLEDAPLTRDRIKNPGEALTVAQMRQQCHVGHVATRAVVRCPHVVELACAPEILSLVAAHFGALPTIVDYAAWWSFAGQTGPRDAQLFHFDMDNYKFCKLFIYLTDVDAGAGPHVYVPTSHRLDAIRAARAAAGERGIDEDQFDQWYYMKLRKEDPEVGHFLQMDPVRLTGAGGSRFVTNTRGIHKGLAPERSDRLVLQIEYGLLPAPTELIEPLAVGPNKGSPVPARLASELELAYINQLYLRPDL